MEIAVKIYFYKNNHYTEISFFISEVFAWEAYEKGSEVHLQADPTKLELLYKSFKVKKEDFKDQQKESILEKVICSIFLNPIIYF